jgi:hypothetical protein
MQLTGMTEIISEMARKVKILHTEQGYKTEDTCLFSLAVFS